MNEIFTDYFVWDFQSGFRPLSKTTIQDNAEFVFEIRLYIDRWGDDNDR